MKTNLLTIQMRVYLMSMVDPWFPISMNKAKHPSKEKPLDEAKIAKLLDLLDNILAGLTERSKRVYSLSLCHYLKRKIFMLESWDHRLDFQVPKLGNTERLYSR